MTVPSNGSLVMNKGLVSVPSGPHVLVRNTFLNLLTQGFLVVLAIWSLPLLVRGLSKDGFGLLTLVWSFVGYFTLLDFGISRAITKFLSEALALNDESEKHKLIWTSLVSSALLGLISAAAVIAATPFFVTNVFNISPPLVPDARRMFILASISIPFMLTYGVVKGIQMSLQRFDLVNIFQGIIGVVQWVGAVVVLWLGYGLWEVIVLTAGVRIAVSLLSLFQLPFLVPGVFRKLYLLDRLNVKKFFLFGGWLTVSQVISPLFLYLDRMMIGAFLSLGALTYYAVPQEALSRVLIVPMSLTTTLFPLLSERSLLAGGDEKTRALYFRSIKYLVWIMLPVTLLLAGFSHDILALWMGEEFARQSTLIFQVLLAGLFFNAVAQVPTTVLHAYGRPDLTAKFHLIELPVMVVLNLLLIPWIGILGAAITWSIRVVLDAGLLFSNANRCMGQGSLTPRLRAPRAGLMILAGGIISAAVLSLLPQSIVLKISVTSFLGVLYLWATWMYAFDDIDRTFLLQLWTKLFR